MDAIHFFNDRDDGWRDFKDQVQKLDLFLSRLTDYLFSNSLYLFYNFIWNKYLIDYSFVY